MNKKIKAAKKIPNKWAEGPTIAESYEMPDIILSKYPIKYRLKAAVIDSPSYIRGPKPPAPYDPFLAYLEWKMSKPWYSRLFLP